MTNTKRQEEIKAQLEALQAEQAKLEAGDKPATEFKAGKYALATAAGCLFGPYGMIASPIALGVCKGNWKNWALTGLLGGPISLAVFAAVMGGVPETATTPEPEQPAVEQVASAPTPAPEPTYEFTRQEARDEMCSAGATYAADVVAGNMTVNQGKQEVRSYSTYLAQNSPAEKLDLLHRGMACSQLWNF